jgi:predicted  nucleic acid-binding Zn-ribbon protein
MSDLEDRVDTLEDRISSLIDQVSDIEMSQEQTDYEVSDMHSEFVLFRSKSAGEIERIKKVLALATSPDPADLEKYKTLREAFEKYEFARNLILGTNDVEES